MYLDINLATRPYEDSSRFWLRWGGALAVLALFTLVLVYSTVMGWITAAKDRQLIHQYETQIAQRDQESQRAESLLSIPQNRGTRDRSQFLNDLFERKAFSWTKVFEELEHVMPAHLHVVSIRPEMTPDDQLQITLQVAGESRERALELVRNMEDSKRFQQTQITEETNAAAGSGDNAQFEISALYAPALETTAKGGGR